MILPPLRSLRAGVDSQREWTGEALISALRGEIRLLTLLNSDVDALNRSSLTSRLLNEEARRGLSFFVAGGTGDVRRRQQTAPTTFSYRSSRQPISPSPTHAASSMTPYERILTVVLGP